MNVLKLLQSSELGVYGGGGEVARNMMTESTLLRSLSAEPHLSFTTDSNCSTKVKSAAKLMEEAVIVGRQCVE
jgi:hypothetical protein